MSSVLFFFQAEDGIRDLTVTGVQTCALPISESDAQRERLEQYMREVPCRSCKGARPKPEPLAVTVGGLNIWELTSKSVDEIVRYLDQLRLPDAELLIADRRLEENRAPLRVLL